MSDINEPKALPPPQPAPRPSPARDLVPWITAAGFLTLLIGVIWLWQTPPAPSAAGRLETLERRLAQLEQRPAPPPPDLRPFDSRLTALEQRPAPTPPPGPDLRPLLARLQALEQRAPPDLSALASRLAALEQRPALADTVSLVTRLDALAGRQDALSARAQGIEAVGIARQDAAETRLGALEQAATRAKSLEARLEILERRQTATEATTLQVPALADRAARMARVQAAQAALEHGEKLGGIPGAPAALARFATIAPPTEAALRLAFPAAARNATNATSPAADNASLLDRVWARAQSLVTLRQGDHVLIGDPAAGVLARARRTLDAGDLTGTVAALGELTGPAAQAMADWRAQASALLAARAALAELATRS